LFRDTVRFLFQLGLEQCGHRAGIPSFFTSFRAGHSHPQRTHLKSLAGSSGVASSTKPEGSFNFRRFDFASSFLFLVFMVVPPVFHHHPPPSIEKLFSGPAGVQNRM
jgi:hypothetical protein